MISAALHEVLPCLAVATRHAVCRARSGFPQPAVERRQGSAVRVTGRGDIAAGRATRILTRIANGSARR